MRGKSVDVGFISTFVEECVLNKIVTPKDIASEAKIKINEIDDDIRRIELQKTLRSKLIDVVQSFDSPEDDADINNLDDTFIINNFLQDELANRICNYIQDSVAVTVTDLIKFFGEPLKSKIFLAVKQLSESGIITRDLERRFVKGPKWSDLEVRRLG